MDVFEVSLSCDFKADTVGTGYVQSMGKRCEVEFAVCGSHEGSGHVVQLNVGITGGSKDVSFADKIVGCVGSNVVDPGCDAAQKSGVAVY